jgi:hypothetical protein
MPDLSWIARICGSFAGIWAFLSTGLILRSLGKPEASSILMGDTGRPGLRQERAL